MTKVRVMAAVIKCEEKVLICQRPQHKRHGGRWEFPGGKVRGDETDFEATHRELAEELGVVVTEVGDILQSIRDKGSVFQIDFLSAQIEGTPQAREHEQLEWVSATQLLHFDLAPADRIFSEWMIEQED